MKRKGLGKNLGKGYFNIIPNYDSYVHSLSAKGVKSYFPRDKLAKKLYDEDRLDELSDYEKIKNKSALRGKKLSDIRWQIENSDISKEQKLKNIGYLSKDLDAKSISEIEFDGYRVEVEETDNEYPYVVKAYSPDGEVKWKSLLMKTKEEAKEIQKDMVEEIKEKIIGADSYKTEVVDKFKDEGFSVQKTLTDEGLMVEKNGKKIELDKQDLLGEHHKIIIRDWDLIMETYDDFKDQDDVWYSSVSRKVKSLRPYAKGQTRNIIFDKAVDLLRDEGINVHS